MTATPTISVLGICGSLRAESLTRQALTIACAAAQRDGAETTMLGSAELALPLCDGQNAAYPQVQYLRTRVQHANALLIGSPEYCGTLSAVLKNAFEWLSPNGLSGKVVGVLAVAEGTSAQGALAALQQLCWLQGAWVLPMAVTVPLAHATFANLESPSARQVTRQLELLGANLPKAVQRLRRVTV